jgi:hypothetical protein
MAAVRPPSSRFDGITGSPIVPSVILSVNELPGRAASPSAVAIVSTRDQKRGTQSLWPKSPIASGQRHFQLADQADRLLSGRLVP